MDIPSLNKEALAIVEQIDKLSFKKLWEYDNLDEAREKMLEMDHYSKGVYEHRGNRSEIMIPSSDVPGKTLLYIVSVISDILFLWQDILHFIGLLLELKNQAKCFN